MKLKCDTCGNEVHRKPSRVKKLKLAFCNNKCWHDYLSKNKAEVMKQELIKRHKEGGEMIKDLAREIGMESGTLAYRFKKWGVNTRRSYEYPSVIEIITEVSKKRSLESQQNYLQNYKDGKISWRTAHKWASRVWHTTDIPCIICGWDKAERDMHLIIPRLLKEENAISLCPNCHRLVHRGVITESQLKSYLSLKKDIHVSI